MRLERAVRGDTNPAMARAPLRTAAFADLFGKRPELCAAMQADMDMYGQVAPLLCADRAKMAFGEFGVAPSSLEALKQLDAEGLAQTVMETVFQIEWNRHSMVQIGTIMTQMETEFVMSLRFLVVLMR